MTTIVCNREGMAADKRISGAAIFKSQKIFRVNGSLIGFAGNVEQALRFIEWRRSPEQRPQFSDGPSFEALELTPDGALIWWGAEMVGVEVQDEYYAIGSGAQIALGAMAMGATLKEAIQIAARWDTATGKEVQTMNLKGK